MASGMSVREAQGILEIEAPYDKKALKKAYAKLAKRWHPDAVGARGGTEQEKADAERKMMRINQAYATILSTPEAFEEAPATTAVTTVETPKPDRTEVENTTVSAEDAAAYESAHPDEFAEWREAIEELIRTNDVNQYVKTITELAEKEPGYQKPTREKPFGKSWDWVDWAETHTFLERLADPFPASGVYIKRYKKTYDLRDATLFQAFLHFVNRKLHPERYKVEPGKSVIHLGYKDVKKR